MKEKQQLLFRNAGSSGSDWLVAGTLDEFLQNGVYLIKLLNADGTLGLPFTVTNEDVVKLVVSDSGANGKQQTGRAVVQTITFAGSGSAKSTTYTRTGCYCNGKYTWGEWAMTGYAASILHHTGTVASIMPNVLNVWGEVLELDITFMESVDKSVVNEYMIQFTSGEMPTMLLLPGEIKWQVAPVIKANKIYQISIVNNLAVMGEFSNE